MKKEYGAPLVKIFFFDEEDVITSSVTIDGDDNVVFWPGVAKESSVWEE